MTDALPAFHVLRICLPRQVSCGCLCELPVHCMDVVSPKGMLPEMIHILTVAVAEQRKHAGQGSFAPAGHRQTWTIIGEKVAVSIRLATNVLCDLAMETVPPSL